MATRRASFVVFTALTAIAVAVSGDGDFRITSVAPRNRSGSVAEGGTFTLECSVSKSIRSCVWQHRDKTCKLRWSRTNGGLVKNQCRVYDSQIFVVGDYSKHECAIQVQRATSYEAGSWKCEVREYVTRWNIFANPRTVSSLFDIEVRNKTYPTSSIGPRFNSIDEIPDSEYSEAFLEEEDPDEAAESKLALTVISLLFGLVVLLILVVALYFVARKHGFVKRVIRSGRSVRLTELDDADDAWDPNLTAEEPAALDDANEKALTTLGVEERWKYKEARRVVM